MKKPNWDMFMAKHTGNCQVYFEHLCYLLFCKELEVHKGVKRYKNQTAIETEPVQIGDKIIGFQAKFYSNTLSKYKSELIKMLDNINKNYPTLTDLHFYSNAEWGQGKNGKNKTKAEEEVEEKAREYNITISWKLASFF